MKKYFLYLFLITLFSCEDDNEKLITLAQKTIIVYMAADNNLANDALLNIRQMQQGYRETGINFIVFIDVANKPPYLLKIKESACDTIKTFPELNSADPQILNSVLCEIIKRYPADNYGLIMWSHASSWLPAEARLRSFSKDGNTEMNIPEMAKVLPVHFDFIAFDACLMGSVESIYELCDKTDYVIASSTETIADGFPYTQMMPEFLQKSIDLRKIAAMYFDFYNRKENAERSATIALINIRELDRLAMEINKLTEENEAQEIDRSSVQRLDVIVEQYHFDLQDFVNQLFPDANKENFVAQLNKTVLYKAHTPRLLGMYDINIYCGLSCYVSLADRQDLNAYYKTLKWYDKAGIFRLF
ncbi:hypothetical protein AGMMS50262_20900 [Bacteroidia bacterium]|nr:hypothetical protein AGMMS50262_20900 [Bacteroidia bacterium]